MHGRLCFHNIPAQRDVGVANLLSGSSGCCVSPRHVLDARAKGMSRSLLNSLLTWLSSVPQMSFEMSDLIPDLLGALVIMVAAAVTFSLCGIWSVLTSIPRTLATQIILSITLSAPPFSLAAPRVVCRRALRTRARFVEHVPFPCSSRGVPPPLFSISSDTLVGSHPLGTANYSETSGWR